MSTTPYLPKRLSESCTSCGCTRSSWSCQNEELRASRQELEASRERYFDLYDQAPVGYGTLSKDGLILEANLAAAPLLGVTRSGLVMRPLSKFVCKQDRHVYQGYRKDLEARQPHG